MKVYRKVLRGWIAITSVFTFLGGWIILAHSPKPLQTQTTTTTQSVSLPNLPAIQAYDGSNSNGPSLFSNSAPSTTAPAIQQNTGQTFLRTRGS
jgi:hypothetical protein